MDSAKAASLDVLDRTINMDLPLIPANVENVLFAPATSCILKIEILSPKHSAFAFASSARPSMPQALAAQYVSTLLLKS
jgi:hypothetical protein